MAQRSHRLVCLGDAVVDVPVVSKVEGDEGTKVFEVGGEIYEASVLVEDYPVCGGILPVERFTLFCGHGGKSEWACSCFGG